MAFYEKIRTTPLSVLKKMTHEELSDVLEEINREKKQLLSTIHWVEGLIKLKEIEITNKMTTKPDYTAAIKTLVHHQNWRTGADIEHLEPRQIAKAIDVAVHALKVAHAVMQDPSIDMKQEGAQKLYQGEGTWERASNVFKAMRDQMLKEVE